MPLLLSSLSSSSNTTSTYDETLVAEECTKHLTNCSGPSSLKDTSRQLAKELIERNLVSVLKSIQNDQHRVAVRDEIIDLLLRQMTGQVISSSSFNQETTFESDLSNNSNSGNKNSSNSSSSSLPPGSENMAKLISQGSVSLRGSAMTIKRLLEAPDAIVRKTALALLAKIAEDCARERRETLRKLKEEYQGVLIRLLYLNGVIWK